MCGSWRAWYPNCYLPGKFCNPALTTAANQGQEIAAQCLQAKHATNLPTPSCPPGNAEQSRQKQQQHRVKSKQRNDGTSRAESKQAESESLPAWQATLPAYLRAILPACWTSYLLCLALRLLPDATCNGRSADTNGYSATY